MTDDQIPEGVSMARPKIDPALRKRNTLSIRVTDSMRAALQSAADAEGRSLSEEIERRLERSIWSSDAIGALTTDPNLKEAVDRLIQAKELIERFLEKSVWEDYGAFVAFRRAAEQSVNGIAFIPAEEFLARCDKVLQENERAFSEHAAAFPMGLLAELGRTPEERAKLPPPPERKLTPYEDSEILGETAVKVIVKSRVLALAEILKEKVAEAKQQEPRKNAV
jgi:hypothetical protein